MHLLIAFVLPWLTFFTIGRPVAGIICLILQITLIGWIPATIWAVYSLSQYKTDKKIAAALAKNDGWMLRATGAAIKNTLILGCVAQATLDVSVASAIFL